MPVLVAEPVIVVAAYHRVQSNQNVCYGDNNTCYEIDCSSSVPICSRWTRADELGLVCSISSCAFPGVRQSSRNDALLVLCQ
jgi:hypothetical protein